ncbi:MAG: winged-helix domain-containing protein [Chloroflexota bacterium]|jgi:DNA-binding response OmpR family regulator
MPTRDRSQGERRVVLTAENDEADAVLQAAPDLEIVVAAPADLARRAMDLRSRVAVWASADAAAGLTALTTLRTARSEARLLYVTPAEAEAERLAALEAGVDEAVSRPISINELTGRIRLLLRRARPTRRTRLLVGEGIELDLDRKQLLRGHEWIHLRPKEAKLLELFARSPGRVLRRDQILERVWGPNHDGDPRTVDVHVRWLRAKIEPDPHDPVLLLTVRGVGYRLETLPLTER